MSGGVPYIRFFGDDWLSGVQELSLEERGALITLVALTAATGAPPVADFGRLARRFGCSKPKAQKLVSALVDLGKITIENRAIKNERALFETENAQKFVKKQSAIAQKRWAKSDGKPNEINGGSDATALATAYANQNQNQINPPNPPSRGARTIGVSEGVKAKLGMIK